MEYILTSMDMFAGVSENLINYTFNVRNVILTHYVLLSMHFHQMASYQMNEVMYVLLRIPLQVPRSRSRLTVQSVR